MKKSIFILLMALFIMGLSKVYAQDPVLPPTPLDPGCIDLNDPLRPVPGNPYTYQVDVPNPPGSKSFRWYVTQDQNFAVAGAYNWATATPIPGTILAAGDNWYNILTPNANTISLTWQSFTLDPGQYVFIVIYVENQGATCTNNNLKVYRILPLHAFTLDIANVDSTSNSIAGANLAQCVDPVVTATYDPTVLPDGAILYDYGINAFYYAVVAANYSGQYRLTAIVNGLQDATPAGTLGQQANIYWGYSMAGMTNGPVTVDVAENGTIQDLGIVQAPAGGSIGSAGQMIYIKIVIHNRTFEAAGGVDQYPYTFAINGKLVDAAGNPLVADETMDDLHYLNCSPDLYANDIASQILNARPTVNSVIPASPGFLPIGD